MNVIEVSGILAAVLIVAGAGLIVYGPTSFYLGSWLSGVILIVFAFADRAVVLREKDTTSAAKEPLPEESGGMARGPK